eukprot:symbB.v1.2.027826.t1/scaffold2886.1/size67984/7
MASRRAAILVEAFGAEGATPFFPKDERIRQLLRDALNEAKDPLGSYLEELDGRHFEMLIDAFRSHEVPRGANVIVQGRLVEDTTPGLFVLEVGKLEAWKIDKSWPDKEQRVQIYQEPGSVFGELAVIHQAPRAATVEAVEDSRIWSVSRQTVVKITRSFQEAKRMYYDKKLQSVQLLQPLGSEERQQVIECLRPRIYGSGDFVIHEGDEGHDYLPGDYFGELALLSASPRAASVVAETDCTLAVLCEADFRRLLGPLAEFHRPRERRSRASAASRESSRASSGIEGTDRNWRPSQMTGRRATFDMEMPRSSCAKFAAEFSTSQPEFEELFSYSNGTSDECRANNGIVGRSPQKIVNLGVTLASNASKYVSFTKVVGKKD